MPYAPAAYIDYPEWDESWRAFGTTRRSVMTRGGRRARFGSPHSLPGELDHERIWVAVDFTKTRPEPPFDGDDGLTAAVGKLPRRAFCCGLDVRGSFIVRLADLNGYLGRLHDDLRHPQSKSRVSSWSSCEIPTAAPPRRCSSTGPNWLTATSRST